MMILISGQPGNAKTLRAMALMLEEYERNQAAVKEGREQPRRFFTNIAGATKAENPDAFDWVEPIPFAEDPSTPEQQRRPDWRLCPDGSYIVYDEAHADGITEGLERYGVLFPGTGKPGEASDPRIKAMSTHRHRGVDLVFITQWPSKVHHTLRQLVGRHIHMNRALGLHRSGVLTWSRVQSDPYDEREREKAEEEMWPFPPDLYKRYRSATLHTVAHKFRMPKKVWQGLSMLVATLLVVWAIFAYFSPDADAQDKPSGQAAALAREPAGSGGLLPAASQPLKPSGPPATGDYLALDAPRIKPLMGCMSTPKRCLCLDQDGYQLDMTRDDCEAVIERGIPFAGTQPAAGRSGVGGGARPSTAMPTSVGAPSSGATISAAQVSGYGGFGGGSAGSAP